MCVHVICTLVYARNLCTGVGARNLCVGVCAIMLCTGVDARNAAAPKKLNGYLCTYQLVG